VPTRELAMQVTDVLTPLARTVDLSVILVAGGMSYTPQLRAFQRGVDIVVATPGRLIDLMEQRAVDLSRTEIVVLDEADHMADLGFMPAVTEILDAVPSGGQRLLFSATLDGAVDRLVKQYLNDPVTHQVSSGQASVTTMAHHVVNIAPKDKTRLTAEIASRPGRSLIFVRTQRGADRVAEQLREAGVTAGALHGGLTQGARTRVLAVFKEGIVPVLVATDVAARGIDIDKLDLVINYDMPTPPETYVHRIGRTGRAGEVGLAISFCTQAESQRLEAIELYTGSALIPVERGKPAASAQVPKLDAKMDTLRLAGGRKDKLRPGDILGALTGEAGGLAGTDIGKIEIHDKFTYVAVARKVSTRAVESLGAGRIKGKRFKVELVK
jgi:superfamily II DNA/RNA helicase